MSKKSGRVSEIQVTPGHGVVTYFELTPTTNSKKPWKLKRLVDSSAEQDILQRVDEIDVQFPTGSTRAMQAREVAVLIIYMNPKFLKDSKSTERWDFFGTGVQLQKSEFESVPGIVRFTSSLSFDKKLLTIGIHAYGSSAGEQLDFRLEATGTRGRDIQIYRSQDPVISVRRPPS